MISFDFFYILGLIFLMVLFSISFGFFGFYFFDFLYNSWDSDYVDCYDSCINLEDSNPGDCHNLCCLVFDGGVCK